MVAFDVFDTRNEQTMTLISMYTQRGVHIWMLQLVYTGMGLFFYTTGPVSPTEATLGQVRKVFFFKFALREVGQLTCVLISTQYRCKQTHSFVLLLVFYKLRLFLQDWLAEPRLTSYDCPVGHASTLPSTYWLRV